MSEDNVVVTEAESEKPETELVATDEGVSEEKEAESQEGQEEIADSEGDEEPFSKKAARAISRRDKKIGKLRAELEQIKAQLQQSPSKAESTTVPKQEVSKGESTPNPSDFETWDEYQLALTEHIVKKTLEKQTTQQKELEGSRKEQEHYTQRIKDFGVSVESYSDKISDFEVIGERIEKDVLPNLSVDVQKAILDSEDGALALYTLMKEGRIDDLEDMNGRQALQFLAKAEIRGQRFVENLKKVSNAPKPLSAVKGTGTVKKDIMDMSPDEIRKKLNLR